MSRFKRAIAAMFAIGLGLSAGLIVAIPAFALTTPWLVRSGASAGRLCMDVAYAGTANGTGIQQWPCYVGPAQQWSFEYQMTIDRVDYFELVSALSPSGNLKCLDLPWGNPAAGQTLQLWDCLGASRQLWAFEPLVVIDAPVGVYYHQLRNLQTGQCIDVPGGDAAAGEALWQWPCNGSPAQRWYRTLT